MTTPNQYISNNNGVMTPTDIQGTDITSALGLSSTVDEVSSYIESIPTLSAQVDTNTSNIATLSSDISDLSNANLSAQIDTLSSDVESLSSQQIINISDISTLSSDIGSIDTNISDLQSSVSTLSSDVEGISSSVSTLSAGLNESTTVLNGTTAGTVTYGMSTINGVGHFVANFDGYENDSATDQVITFETPFILAPMLLSNIAGLSFTVTATDLTITAPNSTAVFTGVIMVEGIVS